MTVDLKKVLILNLPYLLFVYLFDKLCQAVRLAPGLDASEKFLHLSQGFTEAFSSGLPSLHPLDMLQIGTTSEKGFEQISDSIKCFLSSFPLFYLFLKEKLRTRERFQCGKVRCK